MRHLLAIACLVSAFLIGCGSSNPSQTQQLDGSTTSDSTLGTDVADDAANWDTLADAIGGADTNGTEPDTNGTEPDANGTEDANVTPDVAIGPDANSQKTIETVFVILLENHDWSEIKDSDSAPYINKTLLPIGAHAEQYKNPTDLHPSEPNYIWLEAGDNLGITDDKDPGSHHLSTTDHLVTQLVNAGFTWKVYAEGISGDDCPLVSSGLYGAKHVPQLYFDDVTDNNSSSSQYCIDHVRPFSELESDLANNKVADYNFLVPDLCNDMHGGFNTTCPYVISDLVKIGDTWLSKQVPKILDSDVFKASGVLFIVADEGSNSISDGPIPFIALGTNVKPGYAGNVYYDHSSLLRSIETIFGLPYLRAAKTATDISDLFTKFP
ncbi:MAG: phosphoesterase [Myxococcales bacterium]|nr:phosphoesterase [Myxococcales bacterium]